MPDLSPQASLELYQIARNVILRTQLDAYDEAVLKRILAALDKSKREISARFERSAASMGEWTADRLESLFYELDDMSLGVRTALANDIAEAAGYAGEFAGAQHNDILSLGGRVAGFESVALTASQYRSFFAATPLGGFLLQEWVDRAFSSSMQRAMLTDLQAGVLQGEGYPELVRRLADGFDLLKHEAVTLARTYVQTANVTASQMVAQANSDILRGWRWCATLEHGYHQSGTGTCLRCAALDGEEFTLGEGPPLPLHPRCRCFPVWLTKTWRDLGIDMDELEDVARPYTVRPDENIDEGGRRTILESGFHQGNYADWIMGRSEEVQLNALGPGRLALLKSGEIKFSDLVDGQGNLRTLEELRNLRSTAYIRFRPARDIAEASGQARLIGVRADYGSLPLETARDINTSLAEAKTMGLHVPGRVEFSAGTFKNAMDAPAAYLNADDVLALNPNYVYANLAAKTERAYQDKIWSTGSNQHAFRHEIGHAIAADNAPDRYMKLAEKSYRDGLPLRGTVADMVKNEVSVYAAEGPLELVAEVYAGLMDGKTYSDKTMTLYRAYGGVWK